MLEEYRCTFKSNIRLFLILQLHHEHDDFSNKEAFDILPFLSHLSFLSLKGSVIREREREQLCQLQLTILTTNNSKPGMFNNKIMTSDFLFNDTSFCLACWSLSPELMYGSGFWKYCKSIRYITISFPFILSILKGVCNEKSTVV